MLCSFARKTTRERVRREETERQSNGVISTWNDCRCSYFKRRVKKHLFFSSLYVVRNALNLCARTIVRFVRVSRLLSCRLCCTTLRVQIRAETTMRMRGNRGIINDMIRIWRNGKDQRHHGKWNDTHGLVMRGDVNRDEQRTVAYRRLSCNDSLPKTRLFLFCETRIYVRRFIVASFKLTELRQIMQINV